MKPARPGRPARSPLGSRRTAAQRGPARVQVGGVAGSFRTRVQNGYAAADERCRMPLQPPFNSPKQRAGPCN